MRRFLLTIFGLFVFTVSVVLVLDLVNVALITDSTVSPAYKMWRLFEAYPRDEIAVLGSSRAAHYVPARLSPNVFNYTLDGSGQGETLFLLEAVLKRPGNGPVIVNLDPWGFVGSPKPDLVGDYRLVLGDPRVRALLPAEKRRLKARIPGIRFHGALRTSLTAWLNGKLSVTQHIDNGAKLALFSRTPKEWAFINATIKPADFAFSEAWRARLTDLIAVSRRPVVWVVAPCAPRWMALYGGRERLNAFLRWIATQPNQYAIDLLDLPYGESVFVDPTHLNLEGAERFTDAVLRELHKRSALAPFFLAPDGEDGR